MTQHVIACIDGSAFSMAVADYAAWASHRLPAPLTLLHILDHRLAERPTDLSGSIGFGAQEALLSEMAALDEVKGKLEMKQGRLMLESMQQRAVERGMAAPHLKQMHGDLADTLHELEPEIRLLVLGKRGTTAHLAQEHLGSNLERVIRAMHRPTLVVPAEFVEPTRAMLAFDGSATTRKGVEMLAASPLFAGLEMHVVMAGDRSAESERDLAWAMSALTTAGLSVHGEILAGDAETVLMRYQAAHDVSLIVMGAYGHSRIRHLLVGSTTTAMIRAAKVPVLLLR